MWHPEHPLPYDLPDIDRFIATINANADFFDPSRPIVVARAPGRLDLMGGIADYSGSLVLQLPLSLATCVAAQPADQPLLTIRSLSVDAAEADPLVSLPLADIVPPAGPLSYADARALLGANARQSWAAYVAGVLVVLARERGVYFDHGMRLLIGSDVPAGKGVSSSAAIEVATMRAICAIAGLALDGRDMAILCQRAENLVVGAPCGVMDQMSSACGVQDSLLALLCQPAELQPPVALPPEVEVWGIDSGIRHAVSGADYGSVRVGAFMGYRIIADLAGLAIREDARPAAKIELEDRRWHGYLANIAPSLWETRYRDQVPVTLDGATFLERYGGTTDTVTRVEPARTYAVRQPTAHPIYEHQRVRLFRALLERLTADDGDKETRRQGDKETIAHNPSFSPSPPLPFSLSGQEETRRQGDKETIAHNPSFSPSPPLPFSLSGQEETLMLLGELMFQSHTSYSACGLGSDGTDRLVELVRAEGPAAGLYGAKITGGGSGGTVAVLARRGAAGAVAQVAARYERETGRAAAVIGGSSPGAVQFGVLLLTPEGSP